MDPFALPPLAALLDLASHGLMQLADLLAPLVGASAAAAAVVLVTLVVRAVLIPAGVAQARAEQARARLAPRVEELRKRFRKDPERLNRETMKLYRDAGTSPFAGCLPLLAQAPVLGLVYSIFLRPTIGTHPNALLNEELFGVPLGSSLVGTLAGGSVDIGSVAVFGVLVLLIAAVGELTRRLLRPQASAAAAQSDAVAIPTVPPALLGALQFATAVVAMFVPLAAGLYLLVTVAWTLVQRLILRRRFPVG
jgi:YidC/Oxa1 family membrane protein insertase